MGAKPERAIYYAGPIIFLAAIPVLFAINDTAPVAVFIIVTLGLIGAELLPGMRDILPAPRTAGFRLIPLIYIPAQLATVLWASHAAVHLPPLAFEGLVLALGVTNGVFGILAAHQMVHSRKPAEQALGIAALLGMSYPHFGIAHVHGHHRWVGTERDPVTARLGESFYGYFIRSVLGQLLFAWRFERRRMNRHRFALARNRVHIYAVLLALTYVALAALWGWRALLFFVAQSITGIGILELFNYVSHYGLKRRRRSAGFYEPPNASHSWNSRSRLANLLIFNLGRHSDHHLRAEKPYQQQAPIKGAPNLPAGYVGSTLIALVPPLWRVLMDQRIERLDRVDEHLFPEW